MKTAAIKLELPTELRQAILDYKTQLDAKIEAQDARLKTAQNELAGLRENEEAIAGQIALLESTTRHNDEPGVANLVNLETRLRLLRNQITTAETSVADIQTQEITLLARDLIGDLRNFYLATLPEIITKQLLPFFRTRVAAENIFSKTDAFVSAHGLDTFILWSADSKATPSAVANLYQFLDRALAGSPSLGFDAPSEVQT